MTDGHWSDVDLDENAEFDSGALQLCLDGIEMDARFSREANETLRSWIRASSLLDTVSDAVLLMAMRSILDQCFGGFRAFLTQHLRSRAFSHTQLTTLFDILKQQTNNASLEDRLPANSSATTTGTTAVTTTGSQCAPKTVPNLPDLAPELLHTICAYLPRSDLTRLKPVNRCIASVCLEQMAMISIGVMNASHLLPSYTDNTIGSCIEFTSLRHFKQQQIARICDETQALVLKRTDLQCELKYGRLSAAEQQRIKLQKNEIVRQIQDAKAKQKMLESDETNGDGGGAHPMRMSFHRHILNTKFGSILDAFGAHYDDIDPPHRLVRSFVYPLQKIEKPTHDLVQLMPRSARKLIVFDARLVYFVDLSLKLTTLAQRLPPTQTYMHVDRSPELPGTLTFLKYFDIQTQQLFFVSFLCIDASLTIGELIRYLQWQFVPHLVQQQQQQRADIAENAWFMRLHRCLQHMPDDEVCPKLRVYTEGRNVDNYGGFVTASSSLTRDLVAGAMDTLDGQFVWDGDILVFQLNFMHSWFRRGAHKKQFDFFNAAALTNPTRSHNCVTSWIADQRNIYAVHAYFTNSYGHPQSFDASDEQNMENYLRKHASVSDQVERHKIMAKLKICCQYLKICVAPSYTYGDYRKCIAKSMDNVIAPQHIHLFRKSEHNHTRMCYLQWDKAETAKKAICWNICAFDAQSVTNNERIYTVQVYKPGDIPYTGYNSHVKQITVKLPVAYTVAMLVRQVLSDLRHPLVEHKYRDLASCFSAATSFDCLAAECHTMRCSAEAKCADESVESSGLVPPAVSFVDEIARVKLFLRPKISVDQDTEFVLYVRFLFADKIDLNTHSYTEYCVGLPARIVIKQSDSLQQVIDSGALNKYGIAKVKACYCIRPKANFDTLIQRRHSSYDYYKPYQRFLQHPTHHIGMHVTSSNRRALQEKNCIIGDALFTG